MAVVSNNSGPSDYSENFFTSLSRFSDIIPLHIGIGKTAFTAVDRSLRDRQVVIKTHVCTGDLSQQLLSHIESLRKLSHRNIIDIYDAFLINENSDGCERQPLERLCIVQEMLDVNLQSLISSRQLTSSHSRLFAYQLFAALKHAHGLGIGHFGLKPSNVLICYRNLTLKIADFGMNRLTEDSAVATDDRRRMDSLLSSSPTYWYFAPEQLLGVSDLTVLSDVWSAGCIVAEMLTGRLLFAGEDKMDQLLKFTDALHLNDDDWTKVLHVMPNKLLKNHPFRPRTPLRSQLNISDRQAIHLLELLLAFNASERITADEAFSHTYFADFRHVNGSDIPEDWNVCFRNEASMDRDADATSHSGSDVSPALHGIPRGAYHRHSGRAGNDDIALRNYLNNYSSSTTSSPTSSADDRTPSPNIFDLLDRRTARDHVTKTNIKRRSEASDSDGEKEVAEISDEKLREDLEIGNVSVELLRRLQGRGVDGEIKLPVIMSSNEVDGDVTNLPPLTLSDESHGNSHIPPSADSANAKNTVEEENDVARSTQDFLDFIAKQADFDRIFCKSSPNDGSDGKLPRAVSIEDWSTYCKLAGVTSPDDYNEDSNKRNTASNEGSGAGDKKNKSDVGSRTLEAAECHGSGVGGIGSVSRKLIMDKIETEKVRSRRRRSGVGAQSPTSRRFDANLTSEEFDELYRLPTEHLHKEKQHGIVERNSRSGVPDRHYRHHHRHHSHDSFHAAGGRHSYTDDDRSYRDVEGACGGTDYYCYDDMSMTHTSGIEFDIESPSSATTSFLRFNDGFGASTRISAAAVDDWNEPPSVGEYHCLRGSSLSANGRDAMSSPESPASPQVTNQTGARPKKSPRKHRAA